jgi:hypothetical protein
MQFVVKGIYTMTVEANSFQEAKQVSERILRHEGIKGIVMEAEGVSTNLGGRQMSDKK